MYLHTNFSIFHLSQSKFLRKFYNIQEVGYNFRKFVYSIVNSFNWWTTTSIIYRHSVYFTRGLVAKLFCVKKQEFKELNYISNQTIHCKNLHLQIKNELVHKITDKIQNRHIMNIIQVFLEEFNKKYAE